MTPEETALRAAIERLYVVFSRYPLNQVIEGCPCCTRPADQQALQEQPLRELTGAVLDRFAMKALTTWGDEADLKHFLPRLFEVLAFVRNAYSMPEALVRKLMYAGHGGTEDATWRAWPAEEQEALHDYFHALWRFALTSDDPYPYAEAWLWILLHAHDDLTPFLTAWAEKRASANAMAQLAWFLYINGTELWPRKLDRGSWEEHPVHAQQVIDWIFAPRTVEMMRQELPKIAHHPWLLAHDFAAEYLFWYLEPT